MKPKDKCNNTTGFRTNKGNDSDKSAVVERGDHRLIEVSDGDERE